MLKNFKLIVNEHLTNRRVRKDFIRRALKARDLHIAPGTYIPAVDICALEDGHCQITITPSSHVTDVYHDERKSTEYIIGKAHLSGKAFAAWRLYVDSSALDDQEMVDLCMQAGESIPQSILDRIDWGLFKVDNELWKRDNLEPRTFIQMMNSIHRDANSLTRRSCWVKDLCAIHAPDEITDFLESDTDHEIKEMINSSTWELYTNHKDIHENIR